MPDRDKVINGLECCSVGCVGGNSGCPYQLHGGEDGCDLEGLMADALALIRGQEPVKPKWFLKDSFFRCGACGKELPDSQFKYCPWCGREVKWE